MAPFFLCARHAAVAAFKFVLEVKVNLIVIALKPAERFARAYCFKFDFISFVTLSNLLKFHVVQEGEAPAEPGAVKQSGVSFNTLKTKTRLSVIAMIESLLSNAVWHLAQRELRPPDNKHIFENDSNRPVGSLPTRK